jgi:Ca2+-binding RTX toxin-like protein
MTQQFTADYFYTTQGFGAPNEVRQATLIDLDLGRGNTAGELVIRTGTTAEIFDGFPVLRAPGGGQPNFFEQVSGEVTTTVTFKDGTSLSGVLGLLEFASFAYAATISQYLFDQRALASVGKTVSDIAAAQWDGFVDHNLSWADLGFAPAAVSVPTTATATYFTQSNVTGSTGFGIGTLIDNDLLRDRDSGEAVDLGFGMRPGGGSLQGFGAGSQEISADITFSDGTTISGVDGLFTAFLIAGGGGANQLFLFDTAALAAVGKTVTDIDRVNSFANTDHNLNWTDFGFSGTPVTPVPPPPPPPPPPVLNLITGTAGADVLVGTAGADLIRGGDGSDRLTGGAGPDTFVFGADSRDGNRERDVITDFGAGDSLVLETGAQLAFIEQRANGLFIQIQGGDSIMLLNGGFGIPRTVDGIFTGPQATAPSAPTLNLVDGTVGADRLTGTAGDDLIRGGDGNDRLIGRAGADTFVFGAEARDGNRDSDTITDFNAAADTILFEAGATVRLVEQRGADLFIQLEGDRDSIRVLNANLDAQFAFAFTDGTFTG